MVGSGVFARHKKSNMNLYLNLDKIRAVSLERGKDIFYPEDYDTLAEVNENNHYKLMAYLAQRLGPDAIITDFGTDRGRSAYALGYHGNKVLSLDITNFRRNGGFPDNIKFSLDHYSSHIDHILQSRLISLDTAHDGVFEKEILEFLAEHNWKGILILDDIHLNLEMENVWNNLITCKNKIDVTKLFHFSGTGLVNFDGDIAIVSNKSLGVYIPHGKNRSPEVLEWNKKVFQYFDIAVTYVEFDFNSISHGAALDYIIANSTEPVLLFFENDSIPLNVRTLRYVNNLVASHGVIFGQAQQSNHKIVNGTAQHVYAGPGCLAFSRATWEALGRPSLDSNERGDTAEELTWRAKESGMSVCLTYPSHVQVPNCDLDNGLKFGLGNTFSNIFYHAMQQDNPLSQELFIAKCKEIIV